MASLLGGRLVQGHGGVPTAAVGCVQAVFVRLGTVEAGSVVTH